MNDILLSKWAYKPKNNPNSAGQNTYLKEATESRGLSNVDSLVSLL